MRYKESAIAVMVAVMLGAASFLGGLAAPALAIHDPDATLVASKEISQEDDEWKIVDTVKFVAKEQTSRTSGTITLELVKGTDLLDSEEFSTYGLGSEYETLTADFGGLNVTGSFKVLIMFEGSGSIAANSIQVIDGTEVAGNPDDNPGDDGSGGDGETETGGSSEPDQEVDNVIASKTFTYEGDDGFTIDTVKFVAKEQTSRTSGTIIVAIVQGTDVLADEKFSTYGLSTSYKTMEADFGGLEVTGNFQVVIMYEGSGMIAANSIVVDGATVTSGVPDPDPDPEPSPEGTAQLVVEAVDQDGNKLGGLYVALLNGQNQLVDDGFTEQDATFTLDSAKTYMVEMGNWYNDETQTSFEFEKWKDSTTDNTRRSANPAQFGDDNKETFTALYTVTENASPPVDDGNDGETTSPPPDSPLGTITMYAYRIPSSHWGSTFVGANANMYFVVYNSTGYIIETGYADETGTTIDGLSDSETYWIYPTDCHHCHGGTHDVRFNHWEDSSTDRPRPVTPGNSVGAYYEYVPDTP